MKKAGRILIIAFVLIAIVISIVFFRSMELEEISPDTFADITMIKVTEWNGLVSSEHELISEGGIELVSKYLSEIIARRMIQAFAPESYIAGQGESYVVELWHDGFNRPDVLSLNPGYVQINDVTYPVSAPRSFSLLHLILENLKK